MPLASGTRLGPYEVVSAIGSGGMGEVYRGRDTKLDRDVALKILPDAFVHDPERLARFEREAKTLAALNHPNIAQIFGLESGPSTSSGQGAPALAMELVTGEDLSRRLTRGPIPWAESVPIARQIGEALEAAHDAGIIHRDLKPANIKVRPDGVVKVLDFGLAKTLMSPDLKVGPTNGNLPPLDSNSPTVVGPTFRSGGATELGIILGTASYMAPEQARGRPVDKRADIWAFGAVWFEMLTARAPFPGETITDVIAAVVSRDPDWTWLPGDTPPAIRRLLARCLTKDPKQRLRDIGEVRLALAGDIAAEPGISGAAAATRPSRFGASGWIAAALLFAALGGVLLWPRPVPPQPARPVIRFDVPASSKSILRLDTRPAVALAPDGSALMFAATENGITRLYLRRRDEPDVRALAGTEGASDPAFSPDGKSIAFAGATDLIRMPLDGPPVPLAKINDPRGVAWLDEKTIVFAAGSVSGLSIVPAAGGEPRSLTTVDAGKGDRTHRWPAVVPGGKAVLFTVGTIASPDNYDDARIDAVIVASGERRTVMQGASFVRVTSSGFLIFARAGTLFAAPFDRERLVTTGPAVAVLNGVATDTTTGAAHAAIADDGTLAYVPGATSNADRRLVWSDRRGAIVPLALAPGVYNDVRVSPDGSRVAVLVGPSGSGDIWIYDTRSTAFTRLTFDGVNATPVWSADGKRLYYASPLSSGQKTTLMRRPADGSRDGEAVGSVDSRAYLDALDRSEKLAYFNYYNLTNQNYNDIVTLAIGGSSSSPLVGGRGSAYAAAVSPDGRWLAYQSDEGLRFEIYVRDLTGAGGRWQVSTTGGEEPHWSADGREIFYRNDTRLMAAAVATSPEFRSSPPTVLFEGIYNLRADTGVSYDVDLKTGRFLMVRPADELTRNGAPRTRLVVNWLDDVRRLIAAPAR